jgi:hypothetical protein
MILVIERTIIELFFLKSPNNSYFCPTSPLKGNKKPQQMNVEVYIFNTLEG